MPGSCALHEQKLDCLHHTCLVQDGTPLGDVVLPPWARGSGGNAW